MFTYELDSFREVVEERCIVELVSANDVQVLGDFPSTGIDYLRFLFIMVVDTTSAPGVRKSGRTSWHM